MSPSSPRRFRIPQSRRLVTDVLHFHRKVPICAQDRWFSLAGIRELRLERKPRVSWAAIFLKAYALAAADTPSLRQTWLPWPFPTIYEHPESVAVLAVDRHFLNQRWVFWGKLIAPEKLSLSEIQTNLDRFRDLPPQQVFKKQYHLSLLPTWLRRILWAWNLNVSGQVRTRRIGSFSVTSVAGKESEVQCPPGFHTGNLTYGPLDHSGRSRVTLAYDHRILDGAAAAEALDLMEQMIHGPIAEELLLLSDSEDLSRQPETSRMGNSVSVDV